MIETVTAQTLRSWMEVVIQHTPDAVIAYRLDDGTIIALHMKQFLFCKQDETE